MSRRSSFSLTIGRSRGSMSVYHTAESYWSVKHCACAMALAMTSLSCGSRCWSACTGSASAQAGKQASAARRRRPARSGLEALAQEAEGLVQRELGAGVVAPAAVLELAGLQAALRHHQAMRDAHKLRVRKLDSGAGVAIVVQH